mmetsp:Transcript_81740/g.213221  ORF Transcript_81740/g.213221 Transcript_81740/m.213221 type:complete len:207 (+) Transcript_81740:481-1101(+)
MPAPPSLWRHSRQRQTLCRRRVVTRTCRSCSGGSREASTMATPPVWREPLLVSAPSEPNRCPRSRCPSRRSTPPALAPARRSGTPCGHSSSCSPTRRGPRPGPHRDQCAAAPRCRAGCRHRSTRGRRPGTRWTERLREPGLCPQLAAWPSTRGKPSAWWKTPARSAARHPGPTGCKTRTSTSRSPPGMQASCGMPATTRSPTAWTR